MLRRQKDHTFRLSFIRLRGFKKGKDGNPEETTRYVVQIVRDGASVFKEEFDSPDDAFAVICEKYKRHRTYK